MSYTRSYGAEGERAAADYLRGLGAEILDMNFRCYMGEIDIVAKLDGTLVFCEVKRRRNTLYGTPAEAVTPSKQRKIIRTAEFWLATHPMPELPVRLDILEILPGSFRLIPGAFDASRK